MKTKIILVVLCIIYSGTFLNAQIKLKSTLLSKQELQNIADKNLGMSFYSKNANETTSSSTIWTYSKWIFSGIAIAGFGGRFYYGNAADNSYSEYNSATTPESANEKRSEVEKNVNMANTSLIVGSVSAGLAVLFWLLDSPGEPEPPLKFELPKEEKKQPVSPPVLASTIQFLDTDNDNFLEAGDRGKIILTITNSGNGIAYHLKPTLKYSNPNIKFIEPQSISQLNPSETKDFIFDLTTNEELPDGRTSFEILVYEDNGFDLTPSAKISIPTKKYRAPKLIVSDIAIKDNNSNRKIDLAEIVEVTARIQNVGEGGARNVKTELQLGENMFLTEESKKPFKLGNIASGEYKDVVFSMYTNNRATAINISLNLIEQRPKFSSNQKLNLALNRVEKTTDELVVQGIEPTQKEIKLSKLNIDIEQNIPEASIKNSDAVAILIGNQRYSNPDVPFVDYSINDASLVREYLIKTLGYDEVNIIYETDATQAKFISIFGSNENYKGRLFNYVKEGKSDVFIFYSGHGAPDPESKQGYFVPVDCDPSTVSLNGYSLNTFYNNLSKINYKSLTVVIDACFSGSSEKGPLLKNISPVFITIDNQIVIKDNTIIFTSSKGDQVSSWYSEKEHSLFTYYFLKGIQGSADINSDKKLTYKELSDYLLENVTYMARRLNSREQTPQVIGDKSKVLIEY